MSPRPAVDVVVPFRGCAAQLDQLAARLGTLALRDGDSVTIADNRSGAAEAQRGAVRIIAASERQTSYHARNRGADTNRAPWLVFVDTDVLAPPDLLDRYFAQPPADETGVLAGAVLDETPQRGACPTAPGRASAAAAVPPASNAKARRHWRRGAPAGRACARPSCGYGARRT